MVLSPLSRFAPALTARVAERLFFTPPRPRRSRGDDWTRRGDPLRVEVEGRTVHAWSWGPRGRPVILLVHGWGGRAAQLTRFVPALVDRGFGVVALDAPGHGRSTSGRSSAPEFARAVRAVARAVGGPGGGLHGLVAHSLGGAAVALALRDGLEARRVVLLAPAAEPPVWVDAFAERLGLTSEVVAAMRRLSERRIGLSWAELNVPALARSQSAALLVVHDRDDAEVPLSDAEAIARAWPDARVVVTEGLGHNRILRDPAVIRAAAEHLGRGVVSEAECACAEDASLPCQACLERTLFLRDERWAAGGAFAA